MDRFVIPSDVTPTRSIYGTYVLASEANAVIAKYMQKLEHFEQMKVSAEYCLNLEHMIAARDIEIKQLEAKLNECTKSV